MLEFCSVLGSTGRIKKSKSAPFVLVASRANKEFARAPSFNRRVWARRHGNCL